MNLARATNGTYNVAMNSTSAREWVAKATGGASARAIAERIEGSTTSVARWLREGRLPAEASIAIARAYHANPIIGLVASDHLTMDDLELEVAQAGLPKLPTLSLLEELLRRELQGKLTPPSSSSS